MSRLFVDSDRPIFADASSLINLHASGVDALVFAGLPHTVNVPQNAVNELERGRKRGYTNADRLAETVRTGLLKVTALSGLSLEIWESLISGPVSDTLDDGEAATLALTVEHGGIALIDEQKALRIAAARFPQIEVVTTTELFLHPSTVEIIGSQRHVQAIYHALVGAKMNVPSHLMHSVAILIGPERLRDCRSIPRKVRERYCHPAETQIID